MKKYDLGFGHSGNGLSVWNREEVIHRDYRKIAHISPDRAVTLYDPELPDDVVQRIMHVARTSDITVSATQKEPVFHTLPMTRNGQDVLECYDPETGEFDWDRYQYLCDIAEYWDCEE